MDSELFELLAQLQRLMHKSHMHAGPTADNARGQGRILAALKLRDNISTRDLAFLMDIRMSTMNELLTKLEKSGYVSREQSESDKRVFLVKLTDKGRQEPQNENAKPESVFSVLTGEEQIAFRSALEKLVAALKDRVDDDSSVPNDIRRGGYDGHPHQGVHGGIPPHGMRGFMPNGRGFHNEFRGFPPHSRNEFSEPGSNTAPHGKKCPCENTACERHAKCRECKEAHRAAGSPTACEKLRETKG